MPNEQQPFKCGGILGAILEFSKATGSKSDEELKKLDEQWFNMLKPIETPTV